MFPRSVHTDMMWRVSVVVHAIGANPKVLLLTRSEVLKRKIESLLTNYVHPATAWIGLEIPLIFFKEKLISSICDEEREW